MFFNSSTLLFAGILVTAGVLIAWIVWFRRSRKRGRSVWNTEEPPPPTVADMPQVSLLEYPYSVSLIVRPDEPVNLVDAPLHGRVSIKVGRDHEPVVIVDAVNEAGETVAVVGREDAGGDGGHTCGPRPNPRWPDRPCLWPVSRKNLLYPKRENKFI